MQDADVIKAARKYVLDYSEDAIKYLVEQCDPIQLLRAACQFKNQDYHQVMSQNVVSEDDRGSNSSRRRTLSSNSRSVLESSSSAVLSSSGSGDGSPDTLWVMPETGRKVAKTLMATSLPQSDCLIRIDAVRTHVGLQYERLSGGELVRYNEGWLTSSGTVTIAWARSLNELNTNKVQRTAFYVVEELDSQVVFSDSKPENIPAAGGPRSGLDTRPESYGNTLVAEKPPGSIRQGHGSRLQQPQYTSSLTANSTTQTVKPIASRAGQGLKERQQSTASESKIPKLKTSASSVRSASSAQSRAPGGRHPQRTPTPPPPLSLTGPTNEFRVTIVWGQSQLGSTKLQLLAPGESFYEQLNQHLIRKKTPRELDRESDSVRFSPHIEVRDPYCWVSLLEKEVKDDWADAVQWFGKREKDSRIYAVIERDDS